MVLPLRLAPPPLLVRAVRHDVHSITALACALEQRSQDQPPLFVFTGKRTEREQQREIRHVVQ